MHKSYYEVLGVSHKKSAAAIRAAYRRVALGCHKFQYEGEKGNSPIQRAPEGARDVAGSESTRSLWQVAGSRSRSQSVERARHGGTDESPGEYGLYKVISLAKRFGLYSQTVMPEDVFRSEQGRSVLGHPARTANRKKSAVPHGKSADLRAGKNMGGGRRPRRRTLRGFGPDARSESLHYTHTQWEATAVRSQLQTGWR